MAQITLNSSGVASSGSLLLQTNGTTTQATVDTSGNLGLGVTPFANTLGKSIDLANGPGWFGYSTTSYFTTNAYFNSGWLYKANDYATLYQQGSGKHIWATAASGTAGNAISFTQAMTLNVSGNLGVGTTSPSSRLDVVTSENSAWATQITNNGSTNAHGLLVYTGASSTGIPFAVYGATTERMRIDSSGNLLVGTTSSSNTSGTGHKLSPDGRYSIVAPSTTADTFNYYNSTAGAFRFYVTAGGTIFATSTTISAISDQRLKENVRDLEFGLSEVMALKPRRFDWKEGKGQDKKNAAGFIAQEFETVFPDSVGTSKAGEDGVEYKNINHEELIPTLVKAIQELKAEFDAYKATHP